MKTFECWLAEYDSDSIFLDEGWKDWAGKMALGGALTAGAFGLLGRGQTQTAPVSPQSASQQASGPQNANPYEFNFNLGGPRQATVKMDGSGEIGKGTVRFLAVRSIRPEQLNQKYAAQFAKTGILQAAQSPQGTITGFRLVGLQQDGVWITADFEWNTVE